MDLQSLIEEACPIVGELGWAFYFDPATIARGEELGLDVFQFYFLGRGGVLGDVEAPVVASTFGYFNPAVLASMWDSARAVVPPRDAARAFIACAHEFGRARLTGLAELEGFCDAAAKVLAAARERAAGLSLFAGVAAEPTPPPSDAAALAMHQLMVLREFRGSAHLVAVVATGLEARVAHFLHHPGEYALFGWPADEPPAIDDDDAEALAEAEELTDRLVAPAYGVLDDAEARALVAGLRVCKAAIAPPQIPRS